MGKVTLLVPPESYDKYGQPRYPIRQTKGLAQFQSDRLMRSASSEGYLERIDSAIFTAVRKEVESLSFGRTVDMLEIGGGTGHFFELVRDYVATYVNVEPSEIDLDEAAQERLRNPQYDCIKCSAEDIPLFDNSVNIALSIASLDHVPDYRKVLCEIARCLRPEGHFLLVLNNRRSWWKILLAKSMYLQRREAAIAEEHYIQWSLGECRRIVSEYLPIVKMASLIFFPYLPLAWRILLPFSDAIGPRLIPLYGGNTFTVCRKESTLNNR